MSGHSADYRTRYRLSPDPAARRSRCPMKRIEPRHIQVPFTASVRVRLTLWYLALMGVIIFVFGGSLYGSSQILLSADAAESSLEAQLYQDSQQFASKYKQALLRRQSLS